MRSEIPYLRLFTFDVRRATARCSMSLWSTVSPLIPAVMMMFEFRDETRSDRFDHRLMIQRTRGREKKKEANEWRESVVLMWPASARSPVDGQNSRCVTHAGIVRFLHSTRLSVFDKLHNKLRYLIGRGGGPRCLLDRLRERRAVHLIRTRPQCRNLRPGGD